MPERLAATALIDAVRVVFCAAIAELIPAIELLSVATAAARFPAAWPAAISASEASRKPIRRFVSATR